MGEPNYNVLEQNVLTLEDHLQLLVNALADGNDHWPVVRLHIPGTNASWLISEIDPDDTDRVFGLCDLGLGCPELGFVSLSEMLALKGSLGINVERDPNFTADRPIGVYAEAARAAGQIVV